MLDTGNTAGILLTNSTASPVLTVLSSYLKGRVQETVSCLAALHDVGKCHPYFQINILEGDRKLLSPLLAEELLFEDDLTPRVFRHEDESSKFLLKYLDGKVANRKAKQAIAKIAALHHQHAGNMLSVFFNFQRYAKWEQEQQALATQVCEFFQPDWGIFDGCAHLDACGALIWGLMMLSDWLASGQESFLLDETLDFDAYAAQSRDAASKAVAQAGFAPVASLPDEGILRLFPKIPQNGLRPVQHVCEFVRKKWKAHACWPIVTLIEAPMGEGKTEAAMSLAASLASGFCKSGIYFALPTSATSNCMYARVRDCLMDKGLPDVRLLHGHAWMYQATGMREEPQADAEAQAWLAPMRRAILAPYGVGTVDQALMAVLRIRYTVLRLVGLTSKVLIIDEIHAYDAYMQQTLFCLLSWARALCIPVILLSATLPSQKRQQLLESCGCRDDNKDDAKVYPLLTLGFPDGRVERIPVPGTHMRQDVLLTLKSWLKDIQSIASYALFRVRNGGCVGIVANTVAEAQAIYKSLHQQNEDAVNIFLYHARFPLKTRQRKEEDCVRLFGKDGIRPDRAILVATQVIEQSIDLDFDLLITMLCPVDLLLQRMGRMHRHERKRPLAMRRPEVVVLVPAEPGDLARSPSALVYAPWVLRKSWQLLAARVSIRLPDDIRSLVEEAYPSCAPQDADLKEWTTMAIQNQVRGEFAKAVAFPMPREKTFFMSEGDNLFPGSDEDGVVQGAATRYDDGFSMQAAMVTQEEMGRSKNCTLETARDILMRSFSIPRHWVEDGGIRREPGQGKLRGITLLEAKDEISRGEHWIIRADSELGIIKEGL